MAEQELKPQVKEEAPTKGERVRPGRVFLPAVDIFETPQALVLVADMPGVSSDAGFCMESNSNDERESRASR